MDWPSITRWLAKVWRSPWVVSLFASPALAHASGTTRFTLLWLSLTQVRFNERGLKVAESPPRFAAYTPWNDASPPPFLTKYSLLDALGRVGRKTVDRDPTLFTSGQGDVTLVTEYGYVGFKTNIKVYKPVAQGGFLQMSRTVDARGKFVQTVQTVTSPTTHDITTSYGYDPAGSVLTIGDTAGNVISATYDDLGRKTQVADPDRGTWQYRWDGLGRLHWQIDARGSTVGMEYDGIGRPTQRQTTAPNNGPTMTDAIWTYDLNGQKGVLSRVEGTSGGTTSDFIRNFSYDDFLRPYQVVTTVSALDRLQPSGTRTFSLEYGYDRVYGREKAIRHPGLSGSGEMVALDYAPTTSSMGGRARRAPRRRSSSARSSTPTTTS